jgi:hypothetical protein
MPKYSTAVAKEHYYNALREIENKIEPASQVKKTMKLIDIPTETYMKADELYNIFKECDWTGEKDIDIIKNKTKLNEDLEKMSLIYNNENIGNLISIHETNLGYKLITSKYPKPDGLDIVTKNFLLTNKEITEKPSEQKQRRPILDSILKTFGRKRKGGKRKTKKSRR